MHEERKLTDHGVLQGYKEINRGLADIPCAMVSETASREKKFKNAAIRLDRSCLSASFEARGCDWWARGQFD